MKESLLVIDKVPGPTSFDVVRQVKRAVGKVKVGHTGSLDPFASGCLVLLLGKATKLSQVLLDADKRYLAKMKLGESTNSMDLTGEVVETMPVPDLTPEKIAEVLKSYEGRWLQTPPMFSAKKVQGVRLYELARKNISVKREEVPVQLYEMRFISYNAPFIEFEVHCSKGTYIRSLADDLGRKLGTVAHLHELRRLSCGDFTLDDSVKLQDFLNDTGSQLERGFHNYVRLVRRETLLRKPRLGYAPSPVGHRQSGQLQSQVRSGNSLLN